MSPGKLARTITLVKYLSKSGTPVNFSEVITSTLYLLPHLLLQFLRFLQDMIEGIEQIDKYPTKIVTNVQKNVGCEIQKHTKIKKGVLIFY